MNKEHKVFIKPNSLRCNATYEFYPQICRRKSIQNKIRLNLQVLKSVAYQRGYTRARVVVCEKISFRCKNVDKIVKSNGQERMIGIIDENYALGNGSGMVGVKLNGTTFIILWLFSLSQCSLSLLFRPVIAIAICNLQLITT